MKLREVYNNLEHYFLNKNDVYEGEYKSWYENGQLCEHSFYVDGDLHGEFKSWHENGQLSEHDFYENGDLHGEIKRWRENGELIEHMFFEHGTDITEKALQYLDNDVMFTLVINVPRLPK